MRTNLYAAAFNVKLLRLIYGFNSSLGLNSNFEIESAHKSVMNLNVDFLKSMNLKVEL